MGKWGVTKTPKTLLIGIAGSSLVAACYFAPFSQHEQWTKWCLWGFLCGFILPVSLVIAMGEPITKFGLTLGDWKLGLASVLICLLVMIPVGYWASGRAEFRDYYKPFVIQLRIAPALFWLTLLAYMIGWEFLFRGFLLFGIANLTPNQKQKTQNLQIATAIAFSTLLFGIAHYGKPPLELAGSFVAGIVLCLIALRTRSCFAPIALHAIFFGIFVWQVGQFLGKLGLASN